MQGGLPSIMLEAIKQLEISIKEARGYNNGIETEVRSINDKLLILNDQTQTVIRELNHLKELVTKEGNCKEVKQVQQLESWFVNRKKRK